MRLGELAEPVQERSVFRQLNMAIPGRPGHPGPAFATVSEVPGFEGLMAPLVTEAANRLFASGSVPRSMAVYGLLPQAYEEHALRADMKQLGAAAQQYSIAVTDACAEVTAAVVRARYVVTVYGTPLRSGRLLRPGDDLVLTKWIALGGTAALARVYGDRLRSRYPYSLVDRAEEFAKLMSVETEARAAACFGPCAMYSLSEGGIFNALWRMAERADVGLEVDLKRIPVKQETIEICEYFDVNPYYMYSAGALLVGTENGQGLVPELERAGIPAAVIGRATEGRNRVIRRGGERRFLDRPQQEEWYRRAEDMGSIDGKQRFPGRPQQEE